MTMYETCIKSISNQRCNRGPKNDTLRDNALWLFFINKHLWHYFHITQPRDFVLFRWYSSWYFEDCDCDIYLTEFIKFKSQSSWRWSWWYWMLKLVENRTYMWHNSIWDIMIFRWGSWHLDRNDSTAKMMIIAFITWNINLVPLIEGLCSSNPYRFRLLEFNPTS